MIRARFDGAKAGGRRIAGWLLLAAMLAVSCAIASPSRAAEGENANFISLSTCVAPVRDGDAPRALITNPAVFDCRSRQSTFRKGDFWLRLTPADGDPIPAANNRLSFIASWQENARLYVLRADGSLAERSLDNRALSALAHIGGNAVVPLPGDDARAEAVMLRIDNPHHVNDMINEESLITEEASDTAQLRECAVYFAFLGICFALLVYNAVIWFATRARFQLTFCVMLASMLVYGIAHSGIWSILTPNGDITDRYRLGYASLGIASSFGMRFFIDFLESAALTRLGRRLLHAQSLLHLAVTACIVFAPPWAIRTCMEIYVDSFLPVPLVVMLVTFTALRRGSHSARILLLAWLAPVAVAIYRLLCVFGFTPFNVLVDHSTIFSMTIEAMLSSLAMAMRISQISEERDMARAEERFARRLALQLHID